MQVLNFLKSSLQEDSKLILLCGNSECCIVLFSVIFFECYAVVGIISKSYSHYSLSS